MSFKSILVPLSAPALIKTSLQAAFKVAASFHAHIETLHVRQDQRMIAASLMNDSMSGAMIDQIIKDNMKSALANTHKTRAAMEQACKAAGVRAADKPARGNKVTVAWRDEIGYEDHSVVSRGRVADLIVLSRPSTEVDIASSLSLEAALMDSGRPILLVPPKVPSKIGGNVAIAWNGSAEAARAVGQAMPFLLNARKVTILTAAESAREDANPAGLQSLLAWHGIKAKIEKVRARDDVGKALLAAAVRSGANLLVMGAYSHSRVRELVLGGVTRHVLSDAEIPVFLVH